MWSWHSHTKQYSLSPLSPNLDCPYDVTQDLKTDLKESKVSMFSLHGTQSLSKKSNPIKSTTLRNAKLDMWKPKGGGSGREKAMPRARAPTINPSAWGHFGLYNYPSAPADTIWSRRTSWSSHRIVRINCLKQDTNFCVNYSNSNKLLINVCWIN